ncbi:Branched-chain amino acid ABC transporter, amino acid-binding protein (TC 3.A.1.4.1) [hydrothermal vent metagenome]|uniref:Branched-chain amino acid ABC transporter, amino acid-binding protein (TC 3.A.1.4.1) n=1 Tax=hydrothermal vent metagenome TaxID=652676 RepID=A0A3B1CYP9_9ZZZZ
MNRAVAVALMASLIFACASPGKRTADVPKVRAEPESSRLLVAPPEPAPREMSLLYRKAEKFYSRTFYTQAAQMYLKFISGASPGHPLIDNAYFKVGMSLFETGRYRDAQRYFNIVTTRFPKSEIYTEALINSAISLFHLNDYSAAAKLFKQASDLVSNPGHRAYIFFYQGNIAENKSNFLEAVDFYVLAERMAQNNPLVKASSSKLKRIFHNFLGEEELIKITRIYNGQRPAKLAFEELMRIYNQTNDQSLLEAAKAEYKAQFPDHSQSRAGAIAPVGDNAYEPEQIRIGAVLPLSGEGEEAGREIVQGMQLAFNSFNALVREKNIQLIIKDSGGGAEDSAKAVEQLAKDQDVLLIIGPVYSDQFEKAADISTRYRIPVFSPTATAEGAAGLGDYLFRNVLTNSGEAKKMAELAVNKLGLGKFALLYPDDKYGRELSESFSAKVEELGAEIIVSELYNPDQTDFGEQIRALGGMTDEEIRKIIMNLSKNAPNNTPEQINQKLIGLYADRLTTPTIVAYGKPPLTKKNFLPGLLVKYDAIFLPGLYDKVGLILPELEFYNIKGIARLACKGVNHPDFLHIAERYSEGVIFLDGFFKNSESANVRDFVKDYHLYFREEPSSLAAQAYDAARIALSAIAHGSNSRKSMTAYLNSLKFFEGVTGVTNIKPDGDADKSVFFLTVSHGKIIEYKSSPQESEQAGGL